MNPIRLESRIAKDEGCSLTPYPDAGGWSIGYGNRVDPLGNSVHENTPALSEEVAKRLLRADIFTAIQDAFYLVPSFPRLDDVRQEVLVNMAYNLGRFRLSKFRKMLAAVNNFQFSLAADEMKDSKWYGQVGQRGLRLATAMKYGDWAGDN